MAKYRVCLKPIRKYRPLFEAETLDEIAAWLDANCKWGVCGTDGTFQARRYRTLGDVVVAALRQAGDVNEHGNVPLIWREAAESRDLCDRVTPGRTVGMGD